MGLYKTYNEVLVYRYGHRASRDKRVTTHVGLVARAFGASGLVIHGDCDQRVISSLRKVLHVWGGRTYFKITCDNNPKSFIAEWRRRGGEVIHLTMYGVHIDTVVDVIRSSPKPKLIVVGSAKVPGYMYNISDYNVAIGNQPHSEVAALAVFLDKLYRGRELHLRFPDAQLEIIPCERGKRVRKL